MRVALLYPPDASVPMAPFGALPLLQACLKRAGHRVLVLDLAATTFHWALRQENVARFYSYAGSRADPRLRQGIERLLAIPEELVFGAERAARELRDPAVYFDPARMRASSQRVQAALELFSSLRPALDPRNREFTPALYAHLEQSGDGTLTDAYESLHARLRAFDPELVAITVPFSTQIVAAMELARWIHRRFPGCPVTAGGTAVSDSEDVLLTDARFFDHVDYACVGDGEDALGELVEVLGSRGELADVPGLYHRSRAGIVAPRNRRLADMDASPTPDFGGVDYELYLTPEKIALLTTSRGCYYGKCTFCTESFRLHWRRRSSRRVWEDVRHIAREQGITNFMFWDPLTPPAALREVAERAAEERLDINWAAEVKFEPLYTQREYVRVLARGGCNYLQFGFESAVQHVLDAMVKGNDLSEIDVILERLREAEIAVGVFWFIGFPTETEEDARETWRYLVRNRARIAFSGYVGTFGIGADVPVFRDPERYGIEIVYSPAGDPAYRRRDGKDWDPEHLHRTFQARNDLHLVQSGAALLYARRHKERVPALSAHVHVGPPAFLRPSLRELELTIPAQNGFRLAPAPPAPLETRAPLDANEDGRSYAFVAASSALHDLSREDAELVRAVRGGARMAELLARGEPWVEQRLTRLLDYGVFDSRSRHEPRVVEAHVVEAHVVEAHVVEPPHAPPRALPV